MQSDLLGGINKDTLKGSWKEFKGGLQKSWGKITDDEWEETKGDVTQIVGLIQRNYGESKEDVSRKLSDMYRDVTKSEDHPKPERSIDRSIEEDERYYRDGM